MFIGMSEFPTHNQQPSIHDGHRQDQETSPVTDTATEPARPTRVTAAKPPAEMDTRAARGFARRVLGTRKALGELESGDVEILERVSGEKKTVRGNLDELAVVLSTSTGSGGGRDVLTATRDLLAKVSESPMEAVVEATMLAADSPDVFREVFSLTRELGVHDTARTPSGHEVKAASALIQAAQGSDASAALARLERLTGLLG